MNISKLLFIAGVLSIPFSVFIWFLSPNLSGTEFNQIADSALREVLINAHSERWGIFVGLWPATLLILSNIVKECKKPTI